MPYLNLDPNYPSHRKTKRLIMALGEMADAIPIRLWCYCSRLHPKDGAMRGYSEVEVEDLIRWRGEPGKAVNALVEVQFLRRLKDGFCCVDWKEHQGHLEAFSRRGKVAAKARWSKYASGMQEVCLTHAPSVPSVPTVPTRPTLPNRCGSEKRCGWEENGARACMAPAELKAMFCRDHILKAQEMKIHGARSGTWKA